VRLFARIQKINPPYLWFGKGKIHCPLMNPASNLAILDARTMELVSKNEIGSVQSGILLRHLPAEGIYYIVLFWGFLGSLVVRREQPGGAEEDEIDYRAITGPGS
jgi:hypothetical protein